MPRFVDLSGQQFGRLLVIKRAEKRGTRVLWECLCEDGNLSYATTSDLRSGKHRSCGCLQRDVATKHGALAKPRAAIGKRFGRLVLLERVPGPGEAKWQCRCDDGNMKVVTQSNLLTGNVKSCGCLREDMGRMKRQRHLKGERFGRLLVLRRGNHIGKVAAWLCHCDCGTEVTVRTYCLTSGMTKSCGCLKREAGGKRTFQDLTGQTFNRLTVICRGPNNGEHTQWVCRCICGTLHLVDAHKLTTGWTKSCGCIRGEIVIPPDQKRLLRLTHNSWQGMKQRCTNPKAPGYAYYGGRGICFHEPWKQFAAFVADVGIKPSEWHSLDRYPNGDGHYEPGNVRWATKQEQSLNRRLPLISGHPERHSLNGRFITVVDETSASKRSPHEP
jgi:hypothetical protein